MTRNDDIEETFFGFWPARDEYCQIDSFAVDDCGLPDEDTRKALGQTLESFSMPGWKMIISADYLCLLHLKSIGAGLNSERKHNRESEIYDLSLRTSRRSQFQYIEALNAWYFLIFAACRTGRNNVFLHDFSELSSWHCPRLMYTASGKPLRHLRFGRENEPGLRRFGRCAYDKVPAFQTIDLGIFRDAAFFWEIVFDSDLVPVAALGAKIVSEHRLENYKSSVALAWFELESWIFSKTIELGIPTVKKNGWHLGIKEIINKFPKGTLVSNYSQELNDVRNVRNGIAHENVTPSHEQSSHAIETFMEIFNVRSGLRLQVDLHQTPTMGL